MTKRKKLTGSALIRQITLLEGERISISEAQVAEVLARLADVAVAEPATFAVEWGRLMLRAAKRAVR